MWVPGCVREGEGLVGSVPGSDISVIQQHDMADAQPLSCRMQSGCHSGPCACA